MVALARDPRRVPDVSGVEARRADYGEAATLRAALADVTDLVFVSSDGEADLVLEHHRHVVDAAAQGAVRRVAYLSSLDADVVSPFCYARTNALTERALAAACDDVRVVRSGLFLDFVHTLMGDAPEIRLPAEGLVATVARDTVGDALADAVLEDDAPPLQLLADPALTWGELAEQRGQRLVPVDLDTYRIELVRAGESPWWCYAYTSLLQSVAEGRFAGGPAEG